MSRFGDTIRALVDETGYRSVSYLARQIGVKRSTFQGMLDRDNEPDVSPALYAKIARELSVGLDRLVDKDVLQEFVSAARETGAVKEALVAYGIGDDSSEAARRVENYLERIDELVRLIRAETEKLRRNDR